MRRVRHGNVSGPPWAWLAWDLGNAAYYVALYTVPMLTYPIMRVLARMDDAWVRRGVWRVR